MAQVVPRAWRGGALSRRAAWRWLRVSAVRPAAPSRGLATAPPLVIVGRKALPGSDGAVVATLTLNDAKNLNALSEAMGDAFEAAVDDLNVDEAVRCVIVKGAGRAFSAGGDLDWLRERAGRPYDENLATMRRFYERFLSVRTLRAPTIACLHGAAVGAGAGLVLACDVVVASRCAKIGLNFVTLGLPPGMGTSATAPARLGAPLAQRCVYEGAMLDADALLAQASRGFLLNDALHDDAAAAAAAADAFAATIASTPNGSYALRSSVKLTRAALDRDIVLQTDLEAHAQAHAYATLEFNNAIDALVARVYKKARVDNKSN